MREADVREVWAASRSSPYSALRQSLEVCPSAKTGLVDGRVLCMFGVSRPTALSLVGVPWMLGTQEIESNARAFLRRSRQAVEDMKRQGFSVLANFVDARNTHAVEWLRWLGFTVNPAIPYGPFRMPFHPFVMECDNV